MKQTAQMFPPVRRCCSCGIETPNHTTKGKNRTAIIIGITPIMYRNATGGKVLKNAPKIQICERCLVLALSTSPLFPLNSEMHALMASMSESVSRCYSDLVAAGEEKAAQGDADPDNQADASQEMF